jgi:uncharacterized protein YceK
MKRLMLGIIIFFLILSGCSGTTNLYTLTNASNPSTVKASFYRTDAFTWEIYHIVAIDSDFSISRYKSPAVFKIESGTRVFVIKAQFDQGINSAGPFHAQVEVKNAVLRPGMTYHIKSEVSGSVIFVWVEDEMTKERVSERASAAFFGLGRH